MPTTCVCGKVFSVEHAMSCKCVGFTINRHNEIWNITADLMSEVCSNVEVEPQFQPHIGEVMSQRSAVQSDEVCLDIKANGFWGGRGQCTFFDVRVFISHMHLAAESPQSRNAIHIQHEREKKRSYEESLHEVELSTFTPIVFSLIYLVGRDQLQQYNDEKPSITLCREEIVTHCQLGFIVNKEKSQLYRTLAKDTIKFLGFWIDSKDMVISPCPESGESETRSKVTSTETLI